MKQTRKLIVSLLISLCMVFTMLPTVAFATDASSLKTAIESYSSGTGKLYASVNGDTLTVTGTVTNAAKELSLNIDSAVTVKWEASITASLDYSGSLISLTGNGTFQMSDGTINGNKCKAISISDSWTDLNVTGGTVNSDSGDAIYTTRSNGNDIIISGGTVSTAYGTAINTSSVLSISKFITICEEGKVKATKIGGSAIKAGNSGVKVENNAEVRAISGQAIKAGGGNVTISGGTVSSGLNNAIYASGYITVDVSGGTVSNSGVGSSVSTIYMAAITGTHVNVSGTGKVLAQGQGGDAYAIQTNYGDVKVTNGGMVSATSGNAIKASTVTVSGGTVFAYGNTIKGEKQVIYMPEHEDEFTAPTGDGIVIAWNKDAGTKVYDYGSRSDLTVLPDTATVKWSKQGNESGISYANGTNKGFIQINSITVPSVTTAEELKTALESTTAKTINVTENVTMDDNITIGADHTLNIKDGCTLSTGEGSTLTIPWEKILILSGTGTFKVNNKNVDPGVLVSGKLKSNGINIIIASSNLKGILLDSYSLMQVYGGKLDIENTSVNGIAGIGRLLVEGNCLVTIKNAMNEEGCYTNGINTNFTVKNSTVQIQNTGGCTGITINTGEKLIMEDAIINVNNTGSNSFGLFLLKNSEIIADTSSKFILKEGAKLGGIVNKFSDQENVLTNANWITVGAEDATPSSEGLSAGDYLWNGTLFAKSSTSHISTYDVTVNNGSGDGSYEAGATVTITADDPASGKQFKNWEVTSGEIALTNSLNKTTTFVMPANAVEITATYEDVTKPTPPISYNIIEGANGTFTKGTNNTYTIRVAGELNKFASVMVDGVLVASNNYTKKSGSTIIAFSTLYMNNLLLGEHTIQVNFTDGYAQTKLTIVKSETTDSSPDTAEEDKKDDMPKTGDNSPIDWLMTILIVSGAGIFVFKGRRKEEKIENDI